MSSPRSWVPEPACNAPDPSSQSPEPGSQRQDSSSQSRATPSQAPDPRTRGPRPRYQIGWRRPRDRILDPRGQGRRALIPYPRLQLPAPRSLVPPPLPTSQRPELETSIPESANQLRKPSYLSLDHKPLTPDHGNHNQDPASRIPVPRAAIPEPVFQPTCLRSYIPYYGPRIPDCMAQPSGAMYESTRPRSLIPPPAPQLYIPALGRNVQDSRPQVMNRRRGNVEGPMGSGRSCTQPGPGKDPRGGCPGKES